MRIMGLYDLPYNLSWYLWYVSFYLVFSFVVAALSLVILPLVSALWLFLLSLLYFFASMSFAFAVSTLFENPNSGSTLTAVIYYVLAITVSVIERETSKWAISLLPQCAFTLIVQNLGQQLYLGKETPSATLAYRDFTLVQGLVMLIVDFILWTLLYLYLDQVVPHEYRATRKFYFLFTRSFWREMAGKDDDESQSRGLTTDTVPSEVSSVTIDEGIEKPKGELQGKLERDGQVVRIRDLKVEFGNFRAVDGLDLTMYRDELFVLLGHNGAGKSTTINVLSGMLRPKSGAVSIFNKEVPAEMPAIRRSMGICPQNNVLWDDLTVSEHFELFANIRGLPTDKYAMEFATEIELGHKFGARVKTLSGGMKRKLSVGLAFVGDSKLVILDEPSSGMDPSARRRMWDFLRSKREGRILCITTHYMDEADVLADRVGIMENGKLMAYGTTSFLKQQFGTGYTLSIAKKDSTVPDGLLIDVVQKSIDDPSSVRVRSSAGQELSLQVARRSHGDDEQMSRLKSRTYTTEEREGMYDLSVKPNSMQQFFGLMARRLTYSRRNWGGTLAVLLIPFLVILVLMGLQYLGVTVFDARRLGLRWGDSTPYDVYQQEHIIGRWDLSDPEVVRVQRGSQDLPDISAATPLTPDEFTACNQWQPYKMIPSEDPPMNLNLCAGILRFSASLLGEDTAWFEVTALGVTSRSVFADMTALHMTPFALAGDESPGVINYPFPHTAYQNSKSRSNLVLTLAVGGYFAIALTVVAGSLLSYVMMEKTRGIKEQFYVSGCGLLTYWVSSWTFDFVITFIAICPTWIPLVIFDIEAYLEPANMGAVWTLLIGVGCGLIGSFVVAILYYGVVAPGIGLALMWIFRVVPTFPVAQALTSIFFTDLGFLNDPSGERVESNPFDSQILNTCSEVQLEGIDDKTFDTCLAVAGDDVIMLFLFGVIYFGLTILIDYKMNDDKWDPNRDLPVPPEKRGVEDERVIAEKERVSKLDPTTQMIYFKDLKKVYNPGKKNDVWAVRGINYALADGGVFGLLGVNGAGKTTTFRMLCGLIRPSAGHINLVGQPLLGNVYEVRKNIGYCPQDSPLLEGLTTEEHLLLYGRIRGVSPTVLKDHIADLLNILQLERYVGKMATRLSGGNQRKLCVGIALVGHPSLVFLDEPTTGVDPDARRRIWDVIHKIAHGRSKSSAVVLTTHSMEEADALCETMVIQVDGQFRCIGSSQQIKTDYGQGFKLWISFTELSPASSAELLQNFSVLEDALKSDRYGRLTLTDEELQTSLGALDITEPRVVQSIVNTGTLNETDNTRIFTASALAAAVTGGTLHTRVLQWLHSVISPECESLGEIGEFSLPRTINLGQVFSKLSDSKVKEELCFNDFQLSQTTLEQIFNRFAQGDPSIM
ncbi:(ABC) transporter [Perkinsus olseni]|uniref:(ABC) transporter n=3 Tax=Perkinsus olseni TaxID=32597 RepID=A0A7J6NYX0_PEROL|nr:(ABC) transporter [Perkinsus olseni]